jgi:hypothetical protein
MGRFGQYMGIVVLLLGLVSLAVGGFFVAQGVGKDHWIRDRARQENLTFSLTPEQIAKGDLVDSASEMKKAADTIGEHRRAIAPSYQELLKGGKFDPTNPQHISYSQAMNLENYLYLGVLGFGVTQLVLGAGVFMIVVGIALAVTGIVLFVLGRRESQVLSAATVNS